jgi:hypothetical protein
VIAGFCLIALALLAWLVVANMRERRFFDRPALARNRVFDPAVTVAGILLVIFGLAALTALATALAILRGGWRRRRLFLLDVARVRRDFPDLAERDLLVRAVLIRHGRWGDELVEQMVHDYPAVPDLARVVARMERGFRGFR